MSREGHHENGTTPVNTPNQKSTTAVAQSEAAGTNTGLPQTGNHQSVLAQLAGSLMVAFLGIFGLRKKRV
ncbi:LPXTG cell wall anchor domain-containing protein [Limosilactobacillus sp.]|uniref:LPXTG cell wall anchor domain-containing protein n=1 Tax=Limosilactobacillus sp. TaxID=2773925 RepID=UPI003F093AB0